VNRHPLFLRLGIFHHACCNATQYGVQNRLKIIHLSDRRLGRTLAAGEGVSGRTEQGGSREWAISIKAVQVLPSPGTFVLSGSHHWAILIWHLWAIVCPRNRLWLQPTPFKSKVKCLGPFPSKRGDGSFGAFSEVYQRVRSSPSARQNRSENRVPLIHFGQFAKVPVTLEILAMCG
jgi:hypothetical protein